MFLHVEQFFNSELDKLKLSPFTIMPKHKQPVNTIKRFIFSITILPTNPHRSAVNEYPNEGIIEFFLSFCFFTETVPLQINS